MRGSVQKQSRRAVPPKTFFKSICFEILSATAVSTDLDTRRASFVEPPTSKVDIVKNILKTSEETEEATDRPS
jgi:hypothetical protein